MNNPQAFFSEIVKEDSVLTQNYQNFSFRFDKTEKYRQELYILSQKIKTYIQENVTPDEEPAELPVLLKICKLGINITVRITETKICVYTSNDWEKMQPNITSDTLRNESITIYDFLVNFIKAYDNMFIPPSILRSYPSPRNLELLQKTYLKQKYQNSQKSQLNNKKINHMFGSRG